MLATAKDAAVRDPWDGDGAVVEDWTIEPTSDDWLVVLNMLSEG